MGSLKVANVMETVHHVCDASGKSNLMLSRDFITINDVISFKFRCLQKKTFHVVGTSEPIIRPIITELYQT